MTLEEEKKVLDEIKDDPIKFGIIFDLYYSIVFNYIFRRVLDYDISCDIASETFLKAFLNIKRFVWKDIPINYWLYRIATREIAQYYRKKKYIPQSLSLLLEKRDWELIDPKSTLEDRNCAESELRKYDDFQLIQNKLKHLPLKYQEVLVLRYYEHKSGKEMALILNKNENTIKSLLSRGLEKFGLSLPHSYTMVGICNGRFGIYFIILTHSKLSIYQGGGFQPSKKLKNRINKCKKYKYEKKKMMEE